MCINLVSDSLYRAWSQQLWTGERNKTYECEPNLKQKKNMEMRDWEVVEAGTPVCVVQHKELCLVKLRLFTKIWQDFNFKILKKKKTTKQPNKKKETQKK